MFNNMVLSGAENTQQHAEHVDSINAVPVPERDTGTKMNLSMTSGANEVEDKDEIHIATIGKYFSKGLLMGARRNSGVILSQLFRGFSKAIEHKDEIGAPEFADAHEDGVRKADKSGMKPS